MRYSAIVHPIGMAEDWIISDIEGKTHEERAMFIFEYLMNIGVSQFSVIHYAPMVKCKILSDIAIDTINLN